MWCVQSQLVLSILVVGDVRSIECCILFCGAKVGWGGRGLDFYLDVSDLLAYIT